MSPAPTVQKSVADYIRAIPDFPHEGIIFRDVTTLFGDAEGLALCVDQMIAPYRQMRFDAVVGLEARGFIIGGAMAYAMKTRFVPVRKKGKLPGSVLSEDYTLEYGAATVEIHTDALAPGDNVLIVDDLLATGGTACAGIALVERLGARVEHCAFIVDLPALGGGKKLRDMGLRLHALCTFDGL